MRKSSRFRSQQAERSRLLAVAVWFLQDFSYRGRTVVVAAFLLAALWAACTFVWHKWSASIESRDEYRITADCIRLTPPPPWLKTNIAAEALVDAGLPEKLSLIDADLISRLVEALELHPWVDSVIRVEKHLPARIKAEVTYRVPIAAVEAGHDRRSALCPIDANAVRLPATDVPPAMLVRLPRIADAAQVPLVGQAFDGPPIAGALELIGYLGGDWEALSLWTVAARELPETHGEKKYLLYDVITSGGTKIHWGASPGAAPPEESPPEQKLSRLKSYIESHQVDLNSVRSPELIDVRRDLQVKPRMAARPGAKAE